MLRRFHGLEHPPGPQPCGNGGQELTDGIANTPFTIKSLSLDHGKDMSSRQPSPLIRTAGSVAPREQRLLHRIPGYPALYQNVEGTTSTITITNIQVLGTVVSRPQTGTW